MRPVYEQSYERYDKGQEDIGIYYSHLVIMM